MANKANDANWMAILQAFQGTPQGNAAAVAATMMSDIKRDGADQGDVRRNAANVVIAQADDPILFTQHMFQQHPEMEEEFVAFIEDNNLIINSQDDFVDAIKLYLTNKRRYEMFAQGGQFETNQNTIEVQIGDKVYRLLVAETEEEKERGLMNVVEMDPDEGMLFDYSDDPQASISFWMKDTEIPLDIIFINQDGVVISVKQGEPLSEEMITEDSEFVSCVIELNINSGVKAGDKTDLFEDTNNIEDEESEDEESEEDEHPELNVNRLYVYGSDGEIQAELQGGERIFSRKSSKVIIRKAKKAYLSKEDKDYKSLGRYVFNEMKAQDNRDPEYINN